MICKTIHNLKPLAIIIAISTFFCFGFASSSLACSHIDVTTNLEDATFTLYGPEIFTGSGTSWHKVASDGSPIDGIYYEVMTYEIVYGDVEGYITPPPETKELTVPNGIIYFNGIYEPESEYGTSVNITSADVDGDGIDEIITGAGARPNVGDEIEVIMYEYGDYLSTSVFRADVYDQYGVNVAGGDLDGDGMAEIVAGAGPGPNNEAFVQVFDSYGAEKAYFLALDTKYGANVAVGNLGLEAYQEVVDEDENQEVVDVYENQEVVDVYEYQEVVDVDENQEVVDVYEYQEVVDVYEYQEVVDNDEILGKGQESSYTRNMISYVQLRNDESAYYIELVAYADSDEQKRALLRHYKETMSETQYQSIYSQLVQDGHISQDFLEEEE